MNEIQIYGLIYMASYLVMALIVSFIVATAIKIKNEIIQDSDMPIIALISIFWPITIFSILLYFIIFYPFGKLSDIIAEKIRSYTKK